MSKNVVMLMPYSPTAAPLTCIADGTVKQISGVLTVRACGCGRHTRSRLVPDALLKLGLAQRRQGHKAAADLAFEQLRTGHSTSAAARRIPSD